MIADEVLKTVEFDAIKIVFNKFNSVVSFVPTVATVLSPEVFKFFENSSQLVKKA